MHTLLPTLKTYPCELVTTKSCIHWNFILHPNRKYLI